MSKFRESFVARFGEEQAQKIEAAAQLHREGKHLLEAEVFGSDAFRDAFVICISYKCMTRFREDHGITADADELRDWCREVDLLRDHDGPKDYLSLIVGAYDAWMLPNA